MNEHEPNIDDQIIDVEAKKKKQGQMLLILLAAMVMIVGGIVYFSSTLGKKKQDEATDLENIMPLEAKNKRKAHQEKYGRNAPRKLSDENYSADNGLDELTGTSAHYRKRTNEGLTDQDYNEIRQSAATPRPAPARLTKESLNRKNQSTIRSAQAKIAYDANPDTPLFKKSKEELQEERLADLERENNAKMTSAIIQGLEKATTNPAAITGKMQGSEFNSNSYRNGKPSKQQQVGLRNTSNTNTIGRSTSTGFFTETRAIHNEGIGDFNYIPAVIHGNGDGVVVSSGSSVKLRLLSETYLNVNGMKHILTPNTLISGIVKVSNDRVNIVISAIRVGNALLPVQMLAYDIDGAQGLYIPNLMDKNVLGKELANAATRPIQGGIWTQGRIGQQVGTQLATETARTFLQGGAQYARRKMQQVRVTIKPNYKVLLTTGVLENTEETEAIEAY